MRARLIEPIGLTLSFSLDAAGPCPARDGGRHEARRSIDVALDDPRRLWIGNGLDNIPEDAFPTACACGHTLSPHDDYRGSGSRYRYDTPSGRPEPGDLFWNDSAWNPATKQHDARHLIAVCPNGSTWDVDGPSSAGGHWTRTGEPPDITVTPSIWIQIEGPRGYHGWLQNGHFTADLEGRIYPAP